MKAMRLAAVLIPARMRSKRLPGKVMMDLNGKTVLQRTYENVMKAKQPYVVAIAVDSTPELLDHALSLTQYSWATPDSCRCGTHRVAVLCKHIAFSKAEIIVNVQADEVDIDPDLIDALIVKLSENTDIDMVTAVKPRKKGHMGHENSTVRAIIEDGKLTDLIRDTVTEKSSEDYYEHIGIAAFRKGALMKYLKTYPSVRERTQNNEYLTMIDMGLRIAIIEYDGETININTQEDVDKYLGGPKPVKKKKPKARKK
jgi:3-deoxy-manno-octulosonate cytidylyltransferase (CMP-KDO synthetase)